MASRVLLFVLALCCFQVSQGSVLPSWDTLTSAVDSLKNRAEAKINSTLSSIASKVNTVETNLKSNVSSVIADTTAEVTKLVSEAEADGVPAADCGIDATTNLTKIYAALPVSLFHCYIDYLDAFNYYASNIEKDISKSYQAIKDAAAAAEDCSLFDVECYWDLYYNASKFELSEAGDVAFQLTDSGTAAINLVATITKCDEEKSTQAVLDVYEVIPATKNCIAQKKADRTAGSSTSS